MAESSAEIRNRGMRRAFVGHRLVRAALTCGALGAAGLSATPFEVTSTANAGDNTLRWAIEQANASEGEDTISFDLALSPPFEISPGDPLPAITGPVAIDGFQSGDGVFEVVLIGPSNVGTASGLVVASPGVSIRGLSFVGWKRGVQVDYLPQSAQPLEGVGSGEISIRGNLFGLKPDGSIMENEVGVEVQCHDVPVRIGGTGANDGNVVSGNRLHGLVLGAGTCASGGIDVVGNRIGTEADGIGEAPNGVHGIVVRGTDGEADPVRIGDATDLGKNVIAFNGFAGIQVKQFREWVAIRNNSIHSNGQLAIDLEEIVEGISENDAPENLDADTRSHGGNALQNFPILTVDSIGEGVTNLTVTLDSLPDADFDVEIYANAAPDNTPHRARPNADPPQPLPTHGPHGEAEELWYTVALQTDTSGHAQTTVAVPTIADSFSASATLLVDGGGLGFAAGALADRNTSEMSPRVPVFGQTVIVDDGGDDGQPGQLRWAAGQCSAWSGSGLCLIDVQVPGVFLNSTVTIDGRTFLRGGGASVACDTCFTTLLFQGVGTEAEDLIVSAADVSDAVVAAGAAGASLRRFTFEVADGGFALVSSSDIGVEGCSIDTPTWIGANLATCRRCSVGASEFLSGEPYVADNSSGTFGWNDCQASPCAQVTGDSRLLFEWNFSKTDGDESFSAGPALQPTFDLAPIGPNANDAGDNDVGPNGLQNFPQVVSATIVGDELRLVVELESEADRDYRIGVLADGVCGASGRGGGTYFGTIPLVTDGTGSGSASATFGLPLADVDSIVFVSGIATSDAGASSEPGTCTAVTELPVDIFADGFESGDTSAWSVTQPPPP